MTIARLVIEVEGKTNSLQQELTKAARFTTDFSRDVSRALSADALLSGLGRNQRAFVTGMFTGLKRDFKRGMQDISQDFSAGFINEREALAKVRSATANLFREARRGTRDLMTAGVLSPQEGQRLVDIMGQLGARGGQAFTRQSALTSRISRSLEPLEAEFQRRMAIVQKRLFTGRIDAAEARRQGGIAAGAFNDGWLKEIDKIFKRFNVPQEIKNAMIGVLKPQGVGFGQAVTAQQQAIDIAARNIETLQTRFRTTMAKNTLDLAAGIIDPAEFARRGEQAMQALERGLLHGRQRMRQAGLLTDDVERLLANALPRRGRGVAQAGQTQAQQLVEAFEKTYQDRMAALNLDRFTGRITQGKFDELGARAARDFNDSLIRGMNTLRQQGLLSSEDFALITSKFKDAGLKAGTAFRGTFIDSMKGFGASTAQFGQSLTQSVTLPILAAGGAAVKMAADFESAENRLVLGFGPATEQMRSSLAEMRETFPATATEMQNFAVRVAEVFVPLGGATKEIDKMTGAIKDVPRGVDEALRVVGDMSEEIIKLTKNLVILNPGVSAERAFNAIINATVGRTTELKKLGVVINQEIINETAYREGIARTGAVLSAAQNAQAAYIAIMERSALIASAVANAQDTFNLTWEFTKKRITEAGIAVGTVLLPTMTLLLRRINELLKAFAQLDPDVLRAIVRFATLAAIVGPSLVILGKLIGIVASLAGAFRALKIAMSFGSGVGVLASLGRLAGPVGILVSTILLAVSAFVGYKAATNDAAEANANFSASLQTMTSEQLVAAQTAQLLEASRLRQQRDALEASMKQRAITEARLKNERFAGGEQRFKPNPVFTREEQQQVDAIDDRLASVRTRLEDIGKVMEANAAATKKNEEFMRNFRKEVEHFQDEARRQTERERLRQEREEWLRFAAEVRSAIDDVRTAAKLGTDITGPIARVRDFLEQVNVRLSRADPGSRMHSALVQLQNDLELAIKSSEKFDISGLRAAISTQIAEIDSLLSRAKGANFQERMNLTGEINENVAAMRELEAKINVILKERIGTDAQRLKLQRDLIALQERQRKAAAVTGPLTDVFAPGFEKRVDEIGAKLRQQRLTLDIAPSLPPAMREKFERDVKGTIARLRAELAGEIGALLSTNTFAALGDTTQAKLVEEIGEILKRNEIGAADFNVEIAKTERIVGRLAIGMRGLSSIFDLFGEGADSMKQMASGAFNALEAIKQINAAQRARDERIAIDPFATGSGFNLEELAGLVSGITGALGGAASLLQGVQTLFDSDSDFRREQIEIQRTNNERLSDLRLSLEGFIGTTEQSLRIGAALASGQVEREIVKAMNRTAAGSFRGQLDDKGIANFNRQMRNAGITWEQVAKLAKDNGITLLDSKGRLVAGAFDALATVIQAQIELNLRWQNGMNGAAVAIDDLRTSIDLWNDVMNVEDTPQRAIEQAFAELRALAPALVDEFFAGVDPNDATAMEEALQRMTEAFILNQIDFEKFGGLLDKTQLVSIIQLMAGGFDRLRDATDDLTESMLNVPTWFRREQTRFENVAPRDVGEPAAAALIASGAGAPATVVTQQTNWSGDMNVYQQAGESADEFTDRIVAKLRRDRFLDTGSTRLPGLDG